jgi:hypothetical protein
MALHTAGETLKFHPHIHAVVSAGAFFDDDSFVPINLDVYTLHAHFQREVVRLLVKKIEGLQLACEQLLNQLHSGFNVWVGEAIHAHDA